MLPPGTRATRVAVAVGVFASSGRLAPQFAQKGFPSISLSPQSGQKRAFISAPPSLASGIASLAGAPTGRDCRITGCKLHEIPGVDLSG